MHAENQEKASKAEEKTAGIKAILINAAFTLLGTVIGVYGKGCTDVQVAHEKAAADQAIENSRAKAELGLQDRYRGVEGRGRAS